MERDAERRKPGRRDWRTEARNAAEWAVKGAMTGAAASAPWGRGALAGLALGAGASWAAGKVWSRKMWK